MYLITTTAGTARLMSSNEMEMEDLNIGTHQIYNLLNKQQIDDLYNWAKTKISDTQVKRIKEWAGV